MRLQNRHLFTLFFAIFLSLNQTTLSAQCDPEADFTFDEMETCGRLFEPILDSGVEYVSHSWNFGDGSDISSAERGMHVFTSFEDNNLPVMITHTVTTSTGQTFTCSKTFTDVTECAGRWKATFQVECSTLKGYFFSPWYPNNGASVDNSTILWDFGDGESGIGNSIMHPFSNISTLDGAIPELDISMQYDMINTGATSFAGNKVVPISFLEEAIFVGREDETTTFSDISDIFPQQSLLNEKVFVAGKLDFDVPYTFRDCDIVMGAEAEIQVLPYSNGGINTLRILDNSTVKAQSDCSCMWRSITNSSRLVLENGVLIEDALFGVDIHEVQGVGQLPILRMEGTSLHNNFVGLRALEEFGFEQFSGNDFSNNRPLKDKCEMETDFLPFYQSNGLAGMYLNNLAFFNIPPASNTNTFSNTASGIIADDCNIDVLQSCSFSNFLHQDDYDGFSAFGVRFIGADNRRLIQKDCTFDNCVTGISASSSDLVEEVSISNNIMNNVQVGASLIQQFGNIQSGNITGNTINVSLVPDNGGFNFVSGIFFTDLITDATDFSVSSNTIDVEDEAGLCIYMNGTETSNYNDSNVSISNNNLLNVTQGRAAINLQAYSNVTIDNNSDINLESDSEFSAGIRLEGGSNNTLSCNFVDGPFPTNNTDIGISVSMSLDNTLSSNGVQDVFTGIEFSMNCGENSDISCNEFRGNQNVGLLYNSDAETGMQNDRGNNWLTSANFVLFAAENESDNFANNTYEVNTFPPSWSPVEWFLPSDNEPINCANCLPGLVGVVGGGIYPPRDYEIAQNIHPSFYDGGVIWSLEYGLFTKMVENPGTWNGDNILSQFYTENVNSAIGDLYSLKNGIKVALENDAPYRSEILLNKQQKTADLSSAKSSSNSLLTANDAQKISLVSQMSTKIEAIKFATQSTKNNTEIIVSERHTSGSSLSAENNSISTSVTAEENTKAVNKIYLRVIVQQHPITSTDLSTLSSIGHQCPSIGGPGVYGARAMYASFGHELIVTDCADDRNDDSEESANNLSWEDDVKISPNPTSDEFTISLSNKNIEEETITVDIRNSVGQLVKEIITMSNNLKVNATDLPHGLYYVTIINNGNILSTEKVIIID